MAKQVLGKGLAALIPQQKLGDKQAQGKDSLMTEIELKKIKKNQYQPRMDFDKENLKELMSSIKAKGILQPVIVRPSQNGVYELIAGERRLRAAKELGLKTIPAVIKKASRGESLELALVENLQRDNLNAIEEAKAYQKLAEEFVLSQEDIAKKIGKTRTVVTNSIRLLKLPPEVQKMLSTDELSMGHARAILGLENAKDQIAFSKKIVAENLSVREVENLVKKKKNEKTAVKVKPKYQQLSSQVLAIKENMQRILGTKVNIKLKGQKGKIEINYYSLDDLTRISELFRIDKY